MVVRLRTHIMVVCGLIFILILSSIIELILKNTENRQIILLIEQIWLEGDLEICHYLQACLRKLIERNLGKEFLKFQ